MGLLIAAALAWYTVVQTESTEAEAVSYSFPSPTSSPATQGGLGGSKASFWLCPACPLPPTWSLGLLFSWSAFPRAALDVSGY